MLEITPKKLNIIVIEDVNIDFDFINDFKSVPLRLIKCKIDDFYQILKKEIEPIVITRCETFQKITSMIYSPEELSKNYLEYLILQCIDINNCNEFVKSFPCSNFYFIPESGDKFTNSRHLVSLLEIFTNSRIKVLIEDEFLKLKQAYAELKLENERSIAQVEKYISDLEMKTLEYELLNSKLEKEIELRKTYERELSRLNNMLQDYSLKLNEMIKELNTFNYTISHDLKAPLRGIIGYIKELRTEHLNQSELGERANYCLTQVQKLSENMSMMIDDLLMYSKIGFETPSLIKCNLEEIINSVLEDFSKQIQEKQASINLNLNFKEIFSWPRGLKQVFSNLIGNALKYSKPDITPIISISSQQLDKNLLIIVEDNGIGFDMIYAERIFQLFKRVPQEHNIQGTGVGLAIVNKIIEKLKGKIWVESQEGVGTKFFIQLPLLEEERSDGGN